MEHIRAAEPKLRGLWHIRGQVVSAFMLNFFDDIYDIENLVQCRHPQWPCAGDDLLLQDRIHQLHRRSLPQPTHPW